MCAQVSPLLNWKLQDFVRNCFTLHFKWNLFCMSRKLSILRRNHTGESDSGSGVGMKQQVTDITSYWQKERFSWSFQKVCHKMNGFKYKTQINWQYIQVTKVIKNAIEKFLQQQQQKYRQQILLLHDQSLLYCILLVFKMECFNMWNKSMTNKIHTSTQRRCRLSVIEKIQ